MIQTIAAALEQQGYDTLTPVQTAVTDAALDGADLLVSAQTGSGKTVGFGLAIAPTLLDGAERFDHASAPLALVIAPTRELALQVKRELTWLYAQTGAVVVSCVGGMDMRDERRALDRGAHIVVATPGRLRDHIQRGSLDMNSLRAVVLDEADEMLDLGFREDLEFILGEAPETRRTLMFSATVPRAIANLAKSYQKDAVRVQTVAETSQHADIEYRAFNVAQQDAENAIINALRFYEAKNAIVFCNTRAMVNRLTARFSNRGFAVVALSGELTQNERTHALQAMRDGRARVCVATDVAARGIDLPDLELVVHAELPSNADTLLHRSGRTGRAGRKGVSAMIVPGKVRRKAESLLRTAKVTAEWGPAPSADEVIARDQERLLADPAWLESVAESEAGFVATLTEKFSAEQLAAAYLRLYASRQSAPEDLAPAGQDSAPRAPREASSFGPSKWFSVTVGRSQNAEARWLLPMLCRAGDITKDDIGAIRIQQDLTYVELLESAVPGFMKAIGPEMKLEENAVMTALASPPDLKAAPSRKRDDKRDDAPRPRKPRYDDIPPAPPVNEPYIKPVDAAPVPDDGAATPAAEAPRKPRAPRTTAVEARPSHDRPSHDRPSQDRPSYDKKPYEKNPYEKKPYDAAKKPSKPRDAAEGKVGWDPDRKQHDPEVVKPWSRPGGNAGGKPSGKPAGKFGGKPGNKPAGKPAGKPYRKPEAANAAPAKSSAASDPSQRFNPKGLPGKTGSKPGGKPGGKGGKPGGKPKAGGNFTPRRDKG